MLMATDQEKDAESLIDSVLEQCSVYPKPTREQVSENINKVHSITESEGVADVPEHVVVRHVACILDAKQRIDEDEWIQYKGEKQEINH